ncbi:threonine aldolase family protein [Candidatus Neomarinimicrobiota bacterium]
MIDLRSDTLTKPSPEMREAMMAAPVGDDVFGEDPTINELQDEVARLLGKEAALLVPSGTMSNQLAIKTHTNPADEVICELGAHIMNYESAGPAFHSQVQLQPLHGERGIFTAEQVEEVIRPINVHQPPSRLIAIENTANRAGGTIFPLDEIEAISQVAQQHNLGLHMDGARLMNAVVATGIPAAKWSSPFDSVSICLSKGLGAPVGSVLAGSKDFITRAHRYRKLFGGGMRQAGILAAAGLFALKHQVDDLRLDHQRAKTLAECLANLPGILINPDHVETNIVIFTVDEDKFSGDEAEQRLRQAGVNCLAFSKQKVRLVTYRDLSAQDIEGALKIFKEVLG